MTLTRNDLMNTLNLQLGTNFNWSRLSKLDLQRLVEANWRKYDTENNRQHNR